MREAGQSIITSLALDQPIDVQDLGYEALMGTFSGLIYSGIGSGVRRAFGRYSKAVSDRQAAQEAKARAEVREKLLGDAAKTKTASRMPEKLEDFMREMQTAEGDTDTKKIYVDGRAIIDVFQAETDRQIDAIGEKLGIPQEDREDFRQSVRLGLDIELDAPHLIATIASDKQYQQLKDHIKDDPTGLSMYEAIALDEESARRVEQTLADFRAEIDKIKNEGGAIGKFRRDLTDQLKSAMRPDLFGREGGQADLLSLLYAERQIRKASDLGISAEELVKPGTVTVARNGDTVEITIKKPDGTTSTLDSIRESDTANAAQPFLSDAALLDTHEGEWIKKIDKLTDHFNDPQKNTFDTRNPIFVMDTPSVFSLIGIKDRPIETLYSIMKKVLVEKHGLQADLIKQIPRALTDPIMILRSSSKQDSIVVVTELRKKGEKGEAGVLVTFELDTVVDGHDSNLITSIYPKEHSVLGGSDRGWYEREMNKPGQVLYLNRKKMAERQRQDGLRLLPSAFDLRPFFTDQTIPNEADLVNEQSRRAHYQNALEYLQTLYHGTGALFDAFSLLKIGSGTGQQTEGWGAYLSAKPESGKGYAEIVGGAEGVVYEVEAPDDHVMLNFDALMKDQPEVVSRVIDEVLELIPEEDIKYGAFGSDAKTKEKLKQKILNEWTGENFYYTLENYSDELESFDDDRYAGIGNESARRVSLMLSKMGVAGHKMLGLLSRAGHKADADKIYNYVIYDPENTLEIKSRNGVDVKWWSDLNADQKKFAKEIVAGEKAAQKTIKAQGRLTKNKRFITMMKTPLILGLPNIGADTSLYIDIDEYKIFDPVEGALSKHDLSIEDIKDLPLHLADPIAVYVSKKSTPNRPQFMILTDMAKNKNGSPIVAAVHLAKNRGRYVVNNIASVHAKDNGIPASWQPLMVYMNEFKKPQWTQPGLLSVAQPGSPAGTRSSIHTKRDLINARAQKNFEAYQAARGKTSFYQEKTIISLFKKADRSTFLHEMGHVFLDELHSFAKMEGMNEGVVADWGIVADWLGISDVDDITKPKDEAEAARITDAHEKFAAGFEKYLMEGNAPTQELKSAFKRFKEWLIKIYKTVAGIRYKNSAGEWIDFEISDEIRGVFDRLLAVDDAIETEAAASRIGSGLEKISANAHELNIPEEMLDELDALYGETVDAARERLSALAMSDTAPDEQEAIRSRADELKSFVGPSVENMPVYRAIRAMQENESLRLDADEIADGFGSMILELMPDGIFADGPGMPADQAAKLYGFGSASEMIRAIADSLPMEAEIEKRALELAMEERGSTTEENINDRAAEEMLASDEAIDSVIAEAAILRDREREKILEENWHLENQHEEIEAAREDPIRREAVVEWICQNGGLPYWRILQEDSRQGHEIADALKNRMQRETGRSPNGFWNMDKVVREDLSEFAFRVFDELSGTEDSLMSRTADEEASLGEKYTWERLYDILMGEDTPPLSRLEQEYQKGYADAREEERAKRKEAMDPRSEHLRTEEELSPQSRGQGQRSIGVDQDDRVPMPSDGRK